MMEKEYTVSVGKTEQVTEDQWEFMHYYLKINGSTTMSQIETWVRSKGITGVTDVRINELEKIKE